MEKDGSARRRAREQAAWMIGLALIAVAAAGHATISRWQFLSRPTQIYYAVLASAGVVLLASGGWALKARALTRALALASLVPALVLGVNQVLGLVSNSILCFSPG